MKCARGATSCRHLLTARDQRIDRIGGLRAGADDYIVKPFDLGELDARAACQPSDRADPQECWARVYPPTRCALANEKPLALTPRERMCRGACSECAAW